MVAYGDRILFRDERTGRFRKPAPWEKNRHFQVDTLSKGIANFAFKTEERMGQIAEDFAQELLAYAVKNAPWEDRTGDARGGLQADAYLENNHVGVDLYHTVEYGIFLEVRWGAKYAIIIPAVESMGSKLLQKMEGICSEIIYYD